MKDYTSKYPKESLVQSMVDKYMVQYDLDEAKVLCIIKIYSEVKQTKSRT